MSCRFLGSDVLLVGVRVPGAGRAIGGGADRQARRRASRRSRRAASGTRPRSAGTRRRACRRACRPCPSGASASRTPPANAAARAACATAGSLEPRSARPIAVNAGTASSSADAPRARRPEADVLRLVDRRDRVARGGERGRELAVQGHALQRVVGRADAVEHPPEPAGAQVRVQRADLPEVARGEVRLVRAGVADRGQDGDLALGVQVGERVRRRVPAQARVLGERAAVAHASFGRSRR